MTRLFHLGLRRRKNIRDDVRNEIAHHLEESIDLLMSRGLSREEARAEAMRRLGPLAATEDTLYRRARAAAGRVRMRDWLASWVQDLRHTARTLHNEWASASLAAGTLALAIAANAAIFAVLDPLLVRGPAHVTGPGAVKRLYVTTVPRARPAETSSVTAYPLYHAMRARADIFSGVAAYRSPSEMAFGADAAAEPLRARFVTASLFPLLGVRPALGRFFADHEDRAGGTEGVVVLSHELWLRRFGGARDVIGRAVMLDHRPYTVVGVAPEAFTGPELDRVDVWLPLGASPPPTEDWATTWDTRWLQVVGRVRPGLSPDEVNASITETYRASFAGADPSEGEGTVAALPLRFGRNGAEPTELAASRLLAAVTGLLLVIACANVANLSLARATRRRREIAVRRAMGITRARLARLFLAEGVTLAAVGGAIGLVLAYLTAGMVRAALFPAVAWSGSPVGARVVAFTAVVALLAGAAVALAPIFFAGRGSLSATLKEGVRWDGGTRFTVPRALAVSQAALSAVLLIAAGLLAQSLGRVRRLDLGIDTPRIATVTIRWRSAGEHGDATTGAPPSRQGLIAAQVLDGLRRHPGVQSASAAIGLPFRSAHDPVLSVPGYDSLPRLAGGGPYMARVAGDYFATTGTEILDGRGFTRDELARGGGAVVVSETMARTLWPAERAIGRCVAPGGAGERCWPVVGVAQDTRRFAIREAPAMQYYTPLREAALDSAVLLVRARGRTDALVSSLSADITAPYPAISRVDVDALQEALDAQLRPRVIGATLFAVLGALAFLISVVGLYGVIAYTTSQRTHEMGVRIALGATRADVVRLVLRSGVTTAGAGILIGSALALVAAPRLEPLLFETSPHSVGVFGTVGAVLLLSAAAASVIPARRATAVDPVAALRPD